MRHPRQRECVWAELLIELSRSTSQRVRIFVRAVVLVREWAARKRGTPIETVRMLHKLFLFLAEAVEQCPVGRFVRKRRNLRRRARRRAQSTERAHVRGALSRGAHTCVSKRTKRKTWEDGLWDHTVEVGDLKKFFLNHPSVRK